MRPRALWLALHAEVRHPSDPERVMLLAVKVSDLIPGGSGVVTLDGAPQDHVTFQDALIEELNRAIDQVQERVDAIAVRAEA